MYKCIKAAKNTYIKKDKYKCEMWNYIYACSNNIYTNSFYTNNSDIC